MKEGFLIGGGLIFAGLMLELSVGPVVWDAFAWPVNGIVLAGFFVMATAMLFASPHGIHKCYILHITFMCLQQESWRGKTAQGIQQRQADQGSGEQARI